MRYPAAETAERHKRILDSASRMFRRDGFEGVSVADVMKAAGLTHGAFYAHFESKEAMAAAGVERALAEMLNLADHAGEAPDPQAAFVTGYLSQRHRDNPVQGCAMAALGPEIARRTGPVRQAFTTGVRGLIDRLARTVRPAEGADPRAEAITMLSTLLGALVLARAVDDAALSAEILAANRANFGLEPEPAQ